MLEPVLRAFLCAFSTRNWVRSDFLTIGTSRFFVTSPWNHCNGSALLQNGKGKHGIWGEKKIHIGLVKIEQIVYNFRKCLTILNSTASEFQEPCETGACFFEERVFLQCGKEGIGPDYCDSVALCFLRVQLRPGLVPVTCLGAPHRSRYHPASSFPVRNRRAPEKLLRFPPTTGCQP